MEIKDKKQNAEESQIKRHILMEELTEDSRLSSHKKKGGRERERNKYNETTSAKCWNKNNKYYPIGVLYQAKVSFQKLGEKKNMLPADLNYKGY